MEKKPKQNFRHHRGQKKIDYFCFAPAAEDFRWMTIIIIIVGLVTLLSASYPAAIAKTGDPYFYVKRQFRYVIFGLFLMEVVSHLNYKILRKWAKALLICSLLLLCAVLIPGIGVVRNNSRRWINLFGIITFQPSEVAKLAVILSFSASISAKKEKMQKFSAGILPYSCILLLITLLMLLEPHFSGLILILTVGAALMFVGGIKLRWVLGGFLIAIMGTHLFLSGKIAYGQSRIAMWRNPFIDASGAGYQLSQSLIAIGSGGLLGVGFGRSMQKHLFLPEVQNDFIFAIICEEIGLIGAVLVLLLFAALIIKGFLIARTAPDRFGTLICVGIMTVTAGV